MYHCSTVISIYDRQPDKNRNYDFYKKIKHTYVFNYKNDDDIVSNELFGKMGDYIKRHPALYSDWIKLFYSEMLEMSDFDEDGTEYEDVVLAQLDKYAVNDKDRNTFKINDVMNILNQCSGLELINILIKEPYFNNYGFIITNGDDLNNNYNPKFVVEHESFKELYVPKLIYDKLNSYVMTTYIVHMECVGSNRETKLNCFRYPFRLPSTLSKYKREECIGNYIKNNLNDYMNLIEYIMLGLQHKLMSILYDKLHEELTEEGGNYLQKHDYLIQKYVSYDVDEDDGETDPYIGFDEVDIANYIIDIIKDDHLIYELMFDIYDETDFRFRAELVDITTNVHYATID